jgi:hypothetical protein
MLDIFCHFLSSLPSVECPANYSLFQDYTTILLSISSTFAEHFGRLYYLHPSGAPGAPFLFLVFVLALFTLNDEQIWEYILHV